MLSYDAMLKMTGVTIEYLRDVDMSLFLESNIRGGVSFINQRHCQSSIDEEMIYIDGT